MVEVWKPIVGYEGIYEVSNHGRVRSLDRVDSIGRNLKGRIRSVGLNGSGYLCLPLCSEGKQKTHQVHQLVARTFIGPCPDGMEVCHKDHDKTNNIIDNLMYDTRVSNRQQSVQMGIWCKPVQRCDGQRFQSAREAMRLTGIDHSQINKVCRGLLKTAGNFSWKFV